MNEESRVFLAELQKNLTDYFSLEEIETLAFIMGVDYDSLRGATKPTKVNSLIMALSRQGQIELLLREVRKQRRHVAWPDLPKDLTLPQATAETDGATVYQIASLNTGGGPFIGGGVSAGGDVVTGNKSIGGDQVGSSKYVMSGDFRGAILNIESKLDNVTQTLQSMPGASPDQREQLAELVEQLKRSLRTVAPDQVADAESVVRRVDALAQEASAAHPDRVIVDSLGENVRQAAGKLAASFPNILSLVASIIELVAAVIG